MPVKEYPITSGQTEVPKEGKSFFQKLSDFGQAGSNVANSIFQGVAQPFEKVAGSGIRSIQSIPSFVKGDIAKSKEIRSRPIFGQQTLEGSSNLQNLGTAAQVGSYLVGGQGLARGVGLKGVGAITGGLQGGGSYLANTEKPSIAGTLFSTGAGAGLGYLLAAGVAKATELSKRLPTDKELQSALDLTKDKLTTLEQQRGFAQGRGTTQGRGLFKSTQLQPSRQDLAIANSVKGVVDPKASPIENISRVQYTLDQTTSEIRSALENSDAIWNKNLVKGRINSVDLPITVKSDNTLRRSADNFRLAVSKLVNKQDKKAVGLLDLRQEVDTLIKREFPNLYNESQVPKPFSRWILGLRDTLNEAAASTLPEGKLPNGISYRDALRTQSYMIKALDRLAGNTPKVGTTWIQSWIKANPGKVSAIKWIGAITGARYIARRFGIPTP